MHCECAGVEHIVCGTRPLVELRAPWRELAPWLADYSAKQPNLRARRDAARRLDVTLAPPARRRDPLACDCAGRLHLVCRRSFASVLRKGAAPEGPRICPRCSGGGWTYQNRRRDHSALCRIRRMIDRHRDPKPTSHRRLLRTYLRAIRAARAA